MDELQQEPMVVQAPQQMTPMAMLSIAVQQNADIDKLTKLMDLQERWEKNEARKAFVAALAAFKADPPTIYKDRDNKQYESRYTSIGNLVNTVNESLSKQGLSTRWNIDQTTGISVSCILTHCMGHSEQCSMTGPPDTSGKKNPLQEIKSTITYLKVATFEAVTGVASVDGNADDDGNGASDTGLSEADYAEYEKRIKATTKKEAAKAVWQEAVKACAAINDVSSANKLKTVLVEHGKFIDSTAKEEAAA